MNRDSYRIRSNRVDREENRVVWNSVEYIQTQYTSREIEEGRKEEHDPWDGTMDDATGTVTAPESDSGSLDALHSHVGKQINKFCTCTY